MFLNRDLLGADEYLSKLIDAEDKVPYMAHAYFVRYEGRGEGTNKLNRGEEIERKREEKGREEGR